MASAVSLYEPAFRAAPGRMANKIGEVVSFGGRRRALVSDIKRDRAVGKIIV